MQQECIPCAPTRWCEDRSEVDHGLCTCFQSDAREAELKQPASDRWCRGCWCAPCMAGQTQELLDKPGGTYPVEDPKLCACKPACYGWLIAQGCLSFIDSMTMGALSACVPAVVTGAYLTGEVRKKQNPESIRSCQVGTCDFICGYCCACCLNIKNNRDAKALVQFKTTAVVKKQAVQPVTQQPQQEGEGLLPDELRY